MFDKELSDLGKVYLDSLDELNDSKEEALRYVVPMLEELIRVYKEEKVIEQKLNVLEQKMEIIKGKKHG